MAAQFQFQMVTIVHGKVRELNEGQFTDKDGQDVDWTKIVIDFFGGCVTLKPSPDDYKELAKRIRPNMLIEAAGTVKLDGKGGLVMKQFNYIKNNEGQDLIVFNESPAEASANVPSVSIDAAAPPPRRANVFGGGKRDAA